MKNVRKMISTVRGIASEYKFTVKTRVVNLRLDELGRDVQARVFKWTGPGHSDRLFQVD